MPRDLRDEQVAQDQAARIAGRYAVERLLARGGMATVYLAQHVDLRRPVALKVLRPPDDVDNSVDFDERFRLEATTLAALSHPHIVTLHDFGELDDGRCFLAMEFIDGPRLSDVMRAGPMEAGHAIRLLLQVCQALRYAHDQGVIHRDLKPSNLMIQQFEDGSEHVKVVDFGLVKLTDTDQTLTRAGLILGSPHCMSPEQVKGEEVDARSDIYAVGVLLFRAVTGRYPFHGPNSAATMMAHLNKEVPSFYSIDPDMQVPEGMEGVVRKCLGKEPDDRFASMNELIGALSALIDLPPDLYRTATVSAATMHDVAVAASLEASIAQERERDRQVFARTLLIAVALAAIGIGMGWALVTRTVQDRAPQTQKEVPSEILVDAPAEPALVQPDGPDPADVATDDDAQPDNPDTPSEHDEAPQEPPPAASDADETPEVTPAPTATPRPVAKPRPTPRPKPKPTPAPVETPAAAPPATTEPARPASNDGGEKSDDASAPSPDGYKGLPDDW